MRFFVGLHQPKFLERTPVPSCISFGTLRRYKKLPAARGPVFLDSRGFSEIKEHGCYTFGAEEYADFVRRCRDAWGPLLVGASIMDWMCEPFMVEKTGRTVGSHQQLTVNSWVRLNSIAHDLPWVPVLQGWHLDDYHEHVDLYQRHTTVRLAEEQMVGVGSVCRRQGTQEAGEIIRSLYARGLTNLHGFGIKTTGLVGREKLARYLASSDSMAWSSRARNEWRDTERRLCDTDHGSGCANCLAWVLKWRGRLVERIEKVTKCGTQQLLF